MLLTSVVQPLARMRKGYSSCPVCVCVCVCACVCVCLFVRYIYSAFSHV